MHDDQICCGVGALHSLNEMHDANNDQKGLQKMKRHSRMTQGMGSVGGVVVIVIDAVCFVEVTKSDVPVACGADDAPKHQQMGPQALKRLLLVD